MNIIDKILNDLINESKKGYVDFNNEEDIRMLKVYLSEHNVNLDVINAIVDGITEYVENKNKDDNKKEKINEATLQGRTTNYNKPTGAFYKYVELNSDKDKTKFIANNNAKLYDTKDDIFDKNPSIEIEKNDEIKIIDNKESDLVNKGKSYYTKVSYNSRFYFMRISDILKPTGKNVKNIELDTSNKKNPSVWKTFKPGHMQEEKIARLFADNSDADWGFEYKGKEYHIMRLSEPDWHGMGYPKTDVYVKLDKSISKKYEDNLKISLKSENAAFIESWILARRMEQIMGNKKDCKNLILDGLEKIKNGDIRIRSNYGVFCIRPGYNLLELTNISKSEALSGAKKFGPKSSATANCFFKGKASNTIEKFIDSLKDVEKWNPNIGWSIRGNNDSMKNSNCYEKNRDDEWTITKEYMEYFGIR